MIGELTALWGSWLAVAGVVWLAGAYADDVGSRDIKAEAAQRLKSFDLGRVVSGFAVYLDQSFVLVFGEKLFTLRSFAISCLASVAFTTSLFMIWAAIRPEQWREFVNILPSARWGHLALPASFLFLGTTTLNLMPDYLALIKTKFILSLMRRSQRRGVIPMVMFLDVLLAGCIASLAMFVFLWAGMGDLQAALNRTIYFLVPALTLDSVPAVTLEDGRNVLLPSMGIFLWSTIGTSLWILLCAASTILLNRVTVTRLGWASLRRALNLDEKPFTSIGAIGVLVLTVVYLVATPFVVLF
jgi:hypothetical protein